MSMRITKFGHSCVRLSYDGHDVVIDPGGWSQREALDGVAAVLVTHEHPDHWTIDQLRATDAPIHTIRAVADQIREADPAVAERVTVVGPGDTFEVAGFAVQVVGEKHAVIHPELPHFDNSGFVLEAGGTSLFHPGDSFELPGRPVDVHCAPVSAPWAKMSELLDVAREIAAPRTLGIHDRVYSDVGLAMVDDRMKAFLGKVDGTYARPADGQDL
jgi:L-ascorbate metabolism protein UlaG (beta-lactamase superfamily)